MSDRKENQIKKFPEGFYLGEKWDGTHFARPEKLCFEAGSRKFSLENYV